ncbi:MAG: 4-demethylwyosine synthase TYW1 [Halobacteria archaeon]
MRDNEKDLADEEPGGESKNDNAANQGKQNDEDGGKEEVTQVGKPDYHFEGHTACQTCGWTKNAVTGDGKCYKYAFYGIESHRCVQMTPVVTCNERCVFCWRDHEGHAWEVDAKWDDPSEVADASIELQKKLLGGYKGNDEVPMERFEQAMKPRHVAISLDGEPTLYPYLPELIEEFHDRGITTFLVSNGTDPEMLERCDPTQLYVSVDAADRNTFDEVVRAVDDDAYDQLMETLDVLSRKDETRTVIRTTLMDGWNMQNTEGYTELFDRAEVDFVELKAYMHVGHSQSRLDRDAMPEHEKVKEFAYEIQERLDGYGTFKEVPRSRVAMLSRHEDTWVPELKPGSDFWKQDELAPEHKKKARSD